MAWATPDETFTFCGAVMLGLSIEGLRTMLIRLFGPLGAPPGTDPRTDPPGGAASAVTTGAPAFGIACGVRKAVSFSGSGGGGCGAGVAGCGLAAAGFWSLVLDGFASGSCEAGCAAASAAEAAGWG